MTFQHIPSGPTMMVQANGAMPVLIASGQSVTLDYTVPTSPEPTGSWYGLTVEEDAYRSKTATRTETIYGRFGTLGTGLILAPAQGSQFSYTFTQAADGNDTLIYGSYILLYPHSLPQIGSSGNTTAYGYTNVSVCPGHAVGLNWSVFDVATASLTDENGNSVPLTANAASDGGDFSPNGYPSEDQWQYDQSSLGLSAQPVPTQNTTYTLTVVGFGGETATQSVNVSIIPFSVTLTGQVPPSTTTSNSLTIQVGQLVNLEWTAVGAISVAFFAQVAGGQPVQIGSVGIGEYSGGNYYQIGPSSGTFTVYPKTRTVYTAVAQSSGVCGSLTSAPVTVSVTYPPDGSTATAVATIVTSDGSGGPPTPPSGGGGTTVPRRACLSAPGSRFCRAEDNTGGGISFHRANGPVPMLRNGTIWEATSSVTTKTTDSGPALFLDQRGLLYCCFARVTPPTTPPAAPADTSKDGIYLRRSDDLGTTWPAHLDSNGTVELMAIPGGTLPAAASGGGSTLIGAITGNAKDGYKLQTCYKAAGDLIFSAPVVAVDATGAPLAVQNSGIALCRAAENAGRWVLSVLIKGDSATSEFWSADCGQSWTKIQTT